jgi:hypothetical protein
MNTNKLIPILMNIIIEKNRIIELINSYILRIKQLNNSIVDIRSDLYIQNMNGNNIDIYKLLQNINVNTEELKVNIKMIELDENHFNDYTNILNAANHIIKVEEQHAEHVFEPELEKIVKEVIIESEIPDSNIELKESNSEYENETESESESETQSEDENKNKNEYNNEEKNKNKNKNKKEIKEVEKQNGANVKCEFSNNNEYINNNNNSLTKEQIKKLKFNEYRKQQRLLGNPTYCKNSRNKK